MVAGPTEQEHNRGVTPGEEENLWSFEMGVKEEKTAEYKERF